MSKKKVSAKQYLRSIERYAESIKRENDLLNELRLMATASGGIRYDKDNVITSPNGDSFTKLVIEIADKEADIKSMLNCYARNKARILHQMNELDDPKHSEVLYKRYCEYKPFEIISIEMNYSYSRTIHLHGEALQAFERKFLR